MSQAKKYKIVIIEPSQIVQQGILQVLQKYPEFEISHCFSDSQTFLDSWKRNSPDIILYNPGVQGFHKRIIARNIFSDYTDATFIAILYNYVPQDAVSSFDGVIEICDERAQIIKKIKRAVDHNDHQGGNPDNVDLSDREKEILVSVAKGMANKEIAEKYRISVHTVISHRKNITRKTGIRTVPGLTIYALFNNLVTPSEMESNPYM